jgi:hypothetical protein
VFYFPAQIPEPKIRRNCRYYLLNTEHKHRGDSAPKICDENLSIFLADPQVSYYNMHLPLLGVASLVLSAVVMPQINSSYSSAIEIHFFLFHR